MVKAYILDKLAAHPRADVLRQPFTHADTGRTCKPPSGPLILLLFQNYFSVNNTFGVWIKLFIYVSEGQKKNISRTGDSILLKDSDF